MHRYLPPVCSHSEIICCVTQSKGSTIYLPIDLPGFYRFDHIRYPKQPSSHSTNKPSNQQYNQPINQQATNQQCNQPINHTTNQSTNLTTNQPTILITNQPPINLTNHTASHTKTRTSVYSTAPLPSCYRVRGNARVCEVLTISYIYIYKVKW